MSTVPYLSIPRALRAKNISSYSIEAHKAKKSFHSAGRTFLREMARRLGLAEGTYDVRSNPGGMAVSGEVTLHGDDLYVQMSESCLSVGVHLLYRICSSRKDYTGGVNHFVSIADFSEKERQARVLDEMQRLITAERQRKAGTAIAARGR